MALNPTIKRYARDLGVAIPNVEFCPTEFPRLHTFPAPYLPLQLQNDRHDEYYVVLTGKVIAHDSMGFLVPAGLVLDQETVEGLANFGSGNVDFRSVTVTNLVRYTQTDVDQGVVNSRGITVTLNEPVVYSMIRRGGAPLQAYDDADATVDCNGAMTWAVSIGDHIGVASYSWLRSSSDVMSRASGEHLFNSGAVTGIEARKAMDDSSLLRHEAWQLQLEPKTVRTNYCLQYPVVASAAAGHLKGQAVAVAGSMAAFAYGDRVTFDHDSNIVPHAPIAVDVAVLTGDDAADLVAVQAAVDAALVSMQKYHKRTVGQVIKKDTRHPKSLLDKVKTRWDASIPGFEALDRMPGSATDGYPWQMHTANATMGEIVVSLFMR